MRGFVVVEGGFEALVEPEEARVLASLATQLQTLLGEAAENEALSVGDAAVARLLPDAYRDDEEAAAEWRRLSRRALAERKADFAARFARDLAEATEGAEATRILIDERGALDWMRTIADLRLVLAERMGIRQEGDAPDPEQEGAADLYDWLAWMQDDLVRALDDAPRV